MNNPLTLYLENQDNQILDLICGEFKLFIDEWEEVYVQDFQKINNYQYIHTKTSNLLQEEGIELNGACLTGEDYRYVRDYLLYEDNTFKLYFKDIIENVLYYCYVNISGLKKKRSKKSDEYVLTLTMSRTSNWIVEVPFIPPKILPPDDTDNDGKYDIQYGTFVYGKDVVTTTNRVVYVENKGHETAPFKILIEGGGQDILWECINEKGIIGSGQLLGIHNYNIEIDTSPQNIGSRNAKKENLGAFIDYTKISYFNVPKGSCIIKVSGASDWRVVVYEQYRQV